MGCSDSAPVAQKSVPEPLEPLQQPQPAPKPKLEDTPNFIFGHIAQKQYVFARVSLPNRSISSLSIPQGFQPHNFSSMLDIGDKQYFISGGIDFSLQNITNLCFIYEVTAHTVKKVESMHQARYTHAALHFKNEVYVFGGRHFGSDQEAILASCEVFSLKQNKWKQLPSLNVKRCTCYGILWKEQLFVFGGYTGQFQRSQKIEKLNIKQQKWEIIDFELNRGIESGYLITNNKNEVTIFGGNTNSGATASVITINFQEQTVKSHKHLKQQKMLHKGFTQGKEIYIFGGSQKGDLEIYNTIKNTSQIFEIKLNEQFSSEVFQGLSQSEKSINVGYEKIIKKVVNVSEEDDLVLTFGTTEEPFIFELNVSIPSTQVMSVPLDLKLFAESGGVHLKQLQFLIFGGIEDDSLSTVTSDTYIYNHKTRKTIKIDSMTTPRFSFAYQKIANRVYAIGGGNSDPDGNLIILNKCEFFDTDKQTWKEMSNLPVPLISPMALTCRNNLYVFGGMSQNQKRNKAIYRYGKGDDKWIKFDFHLPFGIEAASIYPYKQAEFYIFGGRIDNGDSNQIWDLIFTQNGSSECAIFDKGKMSEKKHSVKVFKPRNQNFLVCLGGTSDLVSYYDIQSLEPLELDGLRRLKQLFSVELSNLNSPKMKSYLTIAITKQN